MELPQTDDYRSLFINNTPLLDVRAPVEFEQGAFPFTQNVPLMNDAEREAVGIQYKNLGQDEAIKLGHELVKGDVKAERVNHWEQFFKQHPEGALYCFRGGMRSKITQQWIYEQTGNIYPRVKGGYKAMRRFLIEELESSAQQIQPVILGGRTGIGKTLFLQKLRQKIDLESLFHHRGSVFGNHATPQPSQIDIENHLSIELIKLLQQDHTRIVFENEAANIGSRNIPECLRGHLKQSPLIILEASLEERIEIIFQEYVIEALAEFQSFYGEDNGINQWVEFMQTAMDKIQRRLGGVRYEKNKHLLDVAIEQQKAGYLETHKGWIEALLVEYYDPMYDYQLSKNNERVIFKGTQAEVFEFLASEYQIR